MGRHSSRLTRSVGAAVALFFTFVAVSAGAGEEEIRRALAELGSKDAAVRVQAIETLAGMQDGRLAALMRAYQSGNLYSWNGKPVLCVQLKKDEAGKKQAPLSDPLTRAPIEVD